MVVTGRDFFVLVILFNVVGDIVVVDFLEIVVVMDFDYVILLFVVFNVVVVVIVVDFCE